jgi:repressor of nif and glnA expression
MRRTTVLLDEPARLAAKRLAAKLDVSPSEVIRRALVRYHDELLGNNGTTRRRRVAAARRLAVLCEGHDAESEVRRLKKEDPFF